MTTSFVRLTTALVTLTILACEEADKPIDATVVECSDAKPCSDGRVCQQGACRDTCDESTPCAEAFCCEEGFCLPDLLCTNTPPVIDSTPEQSAVENTLFSYEVTCNDIDDDLLALATGSADTCGGTLMVLGNGSGRYVLSPGEKDGDSSCTLAVDCLDGKAIASQTAEVAISEDNQAPVITNLPATAAARWDLDNSYNPAAVDTDDPANALVWALDTENCPFDVHVNPDTGATLWTCDQPVVCSATISVTDDGAGALSASNNLAIACNLEPPEITSNPAAEISENSIYTYIVECEGPHDPDLIVGGEDTCGGALNGSGHYILIPTEADGGSHCKLDIVCSDGTSVDEQVATISITEDDQPPEFTNLPETAVGLTKDPATFTVECQDLDEPSTELETSRVASTCSFAVAVNADGQVDWTCSGLEETCEVEIRVEEVGGAALSANDTLTIECYHGYYESTPPPAATEAEAYTYEITCRAGGSSAAITLDIGSEDSCGAGLDDLGDGLGTYHFTPTEDTGGGECTLEIVCIGESGDPITQTLDLAIIEAIDNLPSLERVPLDHDGSFTPEASDLPIGATLAWSKAQSTCSFDDQVAVDADTGEVTWTCGTLAEACEVEVELETNDDPDLTHRETLTLLCNARPELSVAEVPGPFYENRTHAFPITCTDTDHTDPAIGIGDSDTCDGELVTIAGQTEYQFTPDESRGGSSCDVEITCSDGFVAATPVVVTIELAEDNQAPIFTNLPATVDISRAAAGEFTVTVEDHDDKLGMGADTLTMVAEGCTGFANLSGPTVNWDCAGATRDCQVKIEVTDNATEYPGTGVVSGYLTINCVDTPPKVEFFPDGHTFEGDTSTKVIANGLSTWHVRCSDPDNDDLLLTLDNSPGNNTCGGNLQIIIDDLGNVEAEYKFDPPSPSSDGSGTCTIGIKCADDTNDQNVVVTLAVYPPWDAISLGGDSQHTCGNRDGEIWCWGRNHRGQLGFDPATVEGKPTPTRVGADSDWELVSGGWAHTCATKEDGSFWCWGENEHGQLGDDSHDPSFAPVQVGASDWKALDVGTQHSCGIRGSGPDSLWCWGRDEFGALGNDIYYSDSSIPIQVSGSWLTIDTFRHHTCGIKSDNYLWCWGHNHKGQLGVGDIITSPVPKVVSLPSGNDAAMVATGGEHTCATDISNYLFCWGSDEFGQLGDNAPGGFNHTPSTFAGGPNWLTVGLGATHGCAIYSDHRLFCWGNNAAGQLGLDPASGTMHPFPQEVLPAGPHDWQAVTGGEDFTCAIRADNSLWCWGGNSHGQLGDDTTGNNHEPTIVF